MQLLLCLSCVVALACGSPRIPTEQDSTDPTTASPRSDAGHVAKGSADAGHVDKPATTTTPTTATRPPATPATSDSIPKTPAMRAAVSMDDCPGPLAADKVAALQAADVKSGTNRWLYPYQDTVFPRGLPAPVLQWDGPTADALYLHIKSALFEYKGCFAGGAKPNFAVPQAAWDKAGEQSNGAMDPLTIELTLSAGGSITRLPALSSIFALATLKSAIYYNTYNSAIASAQGIADGVVLRLLPGRSEPEVFLSAQSKNGDCVGCHTVSADGSRMIAATANNPNQGQIGEFGSVERPGASYDLLASGMGTQPAPLQNNLKRAGFAAVYPDGSRYVGQGAVDQGPTPTATGIPFPANVWGTFGPETSKLFDTNTGMEIPNSNVVEYAYMPTFSVDGTTLVFNHMEKQGEGGHKLALMDFDRSRDQFSNLRTIYEDKNSKFPAWPFFLPGVVDKGEDRASGHNKQIVFALGETPDFATQDVYLLAQFPHPSDLWWLDVDSGKSALLARANGQDAKNGTYLPYGDRDAHKNYYPTVSPVAAGGYFWLFFTSKRNYGNVFVRDTGEDYPEAKKIWVSAIDINAAPGTDPSHPAFFLPGQELESGNIRAFAALEACRAEGESCDSGIDCCCGFCSDAMCACNVTKCAAIDEKCKTADDCCDETASCVGGYCSAIQLL